MESFHCDTLAITKNGKIENLQFSKAILFVHTEEDSFKSWFVDITSLSNKAFIQELLAGSDIQIYMKAETTNGKILKGEGYIHPNLSSQNATIRGNGELMGYEV